MATTLYIWGVQFTAKNSGISTDKLHDAIKDARNHVDGVCAEVEKDGKRIFLKWMALRRNNPLYEILNQRDPACVLYGIVKIKEFSPEDAKNLADRAIERIDKMSPEIRLIEHSLISIGMSESLLTFDKL